MKALHSLPVRWRLTAWYGAMLVAGFVLLGLALYLGLRALLMDSFWEQLQTQADLVEKLGRVLTGPEPAWEFRYLAGRVDRALTHLARAVDAAGFVVGTHLGRHRRIAGFLNESVAVQLSHRQHRPVLLVPLQVVDWQGRAPWE